MKLFFFFACILISIAGAQPVQTGLDQIDSYSDLFTGKRIGIITNHTAYTQDGRSIAEVFAAMPEVTIGAFFGPEHGIKGKADAGARVASGKDSLQNIPVYSLYGKTRKPTAQMLQHIDLLVFDIQDIGARYYTYIWTMALSMEAAAEHNIPFVVLDRPNPLNGLAVEGNLLDTTFSSFVGMFPIPVRHGLTAGELARLFNGEHWLKNRVKARLTVIPMQHWQRDQWYDQTGLRFIKPSPNMPNPETATVYPGICLLEGTNISEGRGTYEPFLQFGAPWINSAVLAEALTDLHLPGVRFVPKSFTPQSIPGMAAHPKYEGRLCRGVRIHVTDRNRFKSYATGIWITETIFHLYPEQFKWRSTHFDRLCGTDRIRTTIQNGGNIKKLLTSFRQDVAQFKKTREPYLLYK